MYKEVEDCKEWMEYVTPMFMDEIITGKIEIEPKNKFILRVIEKYNTFVVDHSSNINDIDKLSYLTGIYDTLCLIN